MSHSERSFLKNKLNEAAEIVEVGARYQHTRSLGEYVVKGLCILEANEQIAVIYEELSQPENITWVRQLDGEDGWATSTEIDGQPAPRFKKINE